MYSSKYLMYLDANNLYGFTTSEYLPTGGSKWLSEKEIGKVDPAKYNDDSRKGLILEVELKYHKQLHNSHNHYPLAPEHLLVEDSISSDYCKQLKSKFNLPTREEASDQPHG